MGRPFNAPKTLPSVERLRAAFDYNRDAGTLTWKKKPDDAHRAKWWNSVVADKIAGSVHPGSKYLRVVLDREHHFVHRIIWKMETGEDADYIDHINGDGSDNLFSNLRSVTFGDNLKNKSLYRNSTTGFPGVGYHKRDKIWTARMGVGGKQVQLGSFKTKEEAIAAMMGARVILDFHPNHGREAIT